MECYFAGGRRRSSGFSTVSSCFTADSGISVSSTPFPGIGESNSEVFVSKASGNGYPIVQTNGCKSFGPPLNFVGPEPGPECELYIKDFPKDFQEFQLIPHFERFGEIYDFRLMMDYDNNNRGYAYIRYQQKEAASAALEVMKNYLLPNGSALQVQKSYNKCRLFVSNLPKDVPQETIKSLFHQLFPQMSEMTINMNSQNSSAYGFLEFPDHKTALEAKMLSSPGVLDLFGRQIKIVWAFPEANTSKNGDGIKTLFIRHIGLSVNTLDIRHFLLNAVPAKAIRNISPVRDFAFVDFATHEAAKKVKEELNGKVISKNPIEIEFARPPSEDSIHNLKQTDFDQKLRLKCIANYWEMPIYVFGRDYENKRVQNAVVIIKSGGNPFYYFFEVNYTDLVDIQSRIAEVIIHMIDKFSHLPVENLVIKVEKDFFTVVAFMKNMKTSPTLIPCYSFPNVAIHFEEILDLALMANILGTSDLDQLFKTYEANITKPVNTAFVDNLIVNGRNLGCIPPRYPDASFPAILKNQEMTFVLCCAYYYNNVNFLNKGPHEYRLQQFFSNGVICQHIYLISPHLLPLRFVQSKRNAGQSQGHVVYGKLVSLLQTQQHLPFLRQPWFWMPNTLPTAPIITPVALAPQPSTFFNNMPPSQQ
ncbi:RNA-binding protein 47-like [Culicoides brevitarsis]|uniref:RNA-binding protein 47-like n=1 Tax=Culicoides brevitarsis TaxID=469753 RepID=UPI00307B7F01